ncbi:hypothetical protein [Mycobacterium sp.]|nr:hypothetical protein [Mycobacterium sp.]HTQ22975.1 hypothetical protein [Mycobacterium sp.]
MTIRLDKPADLLDDAGHRFDIVAVRHAHQKTSGAESIFEPTHRHRR